MHRILLLALCAAPLVAQVSIGHVHLMVADPDAHRKLWVDVLGGQVVHAGTLEMFKFPGVYIIAGKARTAPADGSEGSTVNHFGFLVPSYQDIKSKLIGAGISFATDNPNTKQIMARFPDKINVEFTEDATVKSAVFHHIHISTPDLEKGREWYVKTFGARAGTRGTFLSAFIPGGEV